MSNIGLYYCCCGKPFDTIEEYIDHHGRCCVEKVDSK